MIFIDDNFLIVFCRLKIEVVMIESISLPSWLDGNEIKIESPEVVGKEDIDLTSMPTEIEEQIIVKDVLYCLIGAEGNYISSNAKGQYKIRSIVRESITSFVDQILPICNDFRIINQFSQGHFAFEYGRIIHALCAAIKTVTAEYVQLIAKLEAHRRLTLPLLIANLQSPAELIHVMASIIVQIGNKRGCQILSILHSTLSSFRGSRQVRKLLEFLFQQSSFPLISFVEKWIFQGEIDDPFEEFFIRIDETISREKYDRTYENFFWKERYKIVKENLPDFVSPNSVISILSAGKSIAVLSECGLRISKSPKLSLESLQRETALENAALDSSLRLCNAIREKYNLEGMIRLFHNVFLFGRGDWIINFFSQASAIMDNDIDHVHIPAIDAVLRQVLPPNCEDIFYTEMEDDQIREHLERIRLTSINNPEGKPDPDFSSKTSKKKNIKSRNPWDYLCLRARIQWPLSLIFNSVTQEKYQIIFRTLLMWNKLKSEMIPVWSFKLDKNVPIQIFGAQFSMFTFVSNFITYSANVIAKTFWSDMKERIRNARGFEELTKIHEDTLDLLIHGLFLFDQSIYNTMCSIHAIISKFNSDLKEWRISVSNVVTRAQDKKDLSNPMISDFKVFSTSVKRLLKLIINFSQEQNSTIRELYLSFVYTLNSNKYYEEPDTQA